VLRRRQLTEDGSVEIITGATPPGRSNDKVGWETAMGGAWEARLAHSMTSSARASSN
jgi:hypothetical protein